MSQPTSIDWCVDPRTGERGMTWNPIRGCSRVSEGCQNCFAERIAARFSGTKVLNGKPRYEDTNQPFHGFAEMTAQGPRWTGKVKPIKDKLGEPLRRRKRTLYFVNSMSDLFHEKLSDGDIDRVFATMALCPQHLFLVLTKRAKRMHAWATRRYLPGAVADMVQIYHRGGPELEWPPPNVMLGVSVEDNAHRDRLDWLMKTPAALRFVSLEPMLEDVNIRPWLEPDCPYAQEESRQRWYETRPRLRWAICGGETGPGARPMAPDWPRRVVRDCKAAEVPVFVKQLTRRGRKIPFAEWPEDLRVQEMPEAS